MATRAAIIYLDPKTLTTTSTYNHYDGYPDNLGAALEAYYDDDINAKKIASEGYISYLDLETGEIEVTNPSDRNVKPEITNLTDDEFQSASDIIDLINSYGADYAYIWSPAVDEWVTFKNSDSKTLYMQLEQMMPELLGRGNFEDGGMMENKDYMNESYKTKWQNFLNENDDAKVRFEKIRDNAYRMLKQEDGRQVNDYVDALVRQIKLKPSDADEYIEYDSTDWKADFDDYISNKMDF